LLLRTTLALVITAAPLAAQSRPDSAFIISLARDLAADSMQGRGPWTPENTAAARRLAAELTRLGARPLSGNSLLVPFTTDERPADTVYNVIAVLPSRSGSVTDSLVGITSHFDHLGVGDPDSTGDRIYNGFLDAALPNAMVIDVARRYAGAPGERSLVVMFFDLEEQGLLGVLAWARDPANRPLIRRMSFVLGVDAGSPAGEATSWELMGGAPEHRFTRLADSLAMLRGWTVRTTPPRPISDVYLFSRFGVPILFPIPGATWKGYTTEQRAEAMKRFDHYHRPSDQYRPDFPWSGTAAYAEWLWEVIRGASGPSN
jgi:hypothetical protein